MKSKYLKIFFIALLVLLLVVGCGKKAMEKETTTTKPSKSGSSPADEFNNLVNSLDKSMKDSEATPKDVPEG